MFPDLVDYPIEHERLRWEARQVLRDYDDTAHLLLRLKLTGTRFPQRAQLPFVVVNGELYSFDAEIAADEMSVRAYFDQPLPEGGRIEFGYGAQVLLRFPQGFTGEVVERLDVSRLAQDTRFVKRFFGDMGIV